jgi:hypothetical protein
MLSPESQHTGDGGANGVARGLQKVLIGIVVVLVMRVPAGAEGMLDAPAARTQLGQTEERLASARLWMLYFFLLCVSSQRPPASPWTA